MGDGLEVSGGAGGLTARLDDLLLAARLVDEAGDTAGATARHLGGLVLSGDVVQATILCPAEVARVEGAVATASGIALAMAIEMEGLSRLTVHAVQVYRDLDEALAALADGAAYVGGWMLGGTLPFLAVGGLAMLAGNPLLAALLVANREALLEGGMESLYDNPWLLEALTAMAPGLVQGTVSSLLLHDPRLLALVSGGHWPTGDYEEAILGLLALAGHGGLFQDTGEFGAEATGRPRGIDLSEDHFLQTLMEQQRLLSQHDAQVQVITIDRGPGLPPAYVVQIPGTQVWDPHRGDNPVDVTTNVHLMSQAGQTQMAAAVIRAMEAAGIPPDAPIMLTGHSQGGITAAALATDADFQDRYPGLQSVVTAGSPVGTFDVPDDVQVLSLEHAQDVVPMLDGQANPDQPNWTTVSQDLEGSGAPVASPDLGAAHDLQNYAWTASLADASDHDSIAAWQEQNQEFFGGSASGQAYQVSPVED